MTQYEGTLASLRARALPEWYEDAKFGIFIHWGLYSIPAYASKLGSISDAFKQDYDRAIAMVPYAEWYANAIKVPGTPSADFHRENYGDAPYSIFREPFLEGVKQWDVEKWADAFKDAGARYVVIVTKHHDGFCLWPSDVKNPNEPNWQTERDIIGEMASAVRARGMRFGVYYSGGIDWTFNRKPLLTFSQFIGSMPGGDYPAYAMAQTRELIARYKPDVLWNDISWPTPLGRLLNLFAHYYNTVPGGVVNDRWPHLGLVMRLMRFRLVQRFADRMAKRFLRKSPDTVEGLVPQPIPHSDFRTPEYTHFKEIQPKKWEMTRGMSHSFAFRRSDTEEDYTPAEELLCDFIDSVSKGGNMLLNVGPRGEDAQIPQEQLSRLAFFGAWLKVNGEAIYGTRPRGKVGDQPDAETAEGETIRFTTAPGVINIILPGRPTWRDVVIRGLSLSGEARLLADGSPVRLEQQGADLRLIFAAPLDGSFMPVVSVRMAG